MRRALVALVLAALAAGPSLVPWWLARESAERDTRERDQERADRVASDALATWDRRARAGRAMLALLCASGPSGERDELARALDASMVFVQESADSAWAPADPDHVAVDVYRENDALRAVDVRGLGVVAALGCTREDVVPARRAWIGWRLSLPRVDDPDDGIAHGDEGVALADEIPEALLAASAQRQVLSFPWVARAGASAVDESSAPTLVAWSHVPVAPAAFPIGASIAALLAALLGLVIGGGARNDPKLEAAARRVGEGDLDVTLDGSSPTASAFNRMTRELKDARTRLARAERIAAWRDIARRIAHEIKNPLTPIKMAMETLRKTHARKHPDFDEIFEESTKTVLEETARLEHIVTEFSRFARMPRPKAESLDVAEVAEKVVSMHDLPAAAATLPEAAKGVRVELKIEGSRPPSVRADREQLTQVLVNLVQNACDAAREKQGDTGGRVIVTLARGENDGVRVVVSDNGPGIPAESRVDVLEPYYTTKSDGTGLGLAIVDRIVSDHGGTLALGDSSELGGAEVTIALRREGPAEEVEASVGA